jgi:hypothetical protein
MLANICDTRAEYRQNFCFSGFTLELGRSTFSLFRDSCFHNLKVLGLSLRLGQGESRVQFASLSALAFRLRRLHKYYNARPSWLLGLNQSKASSNQGRKHP